MKTLPDATVHPFNLTDGHYGLTKREYFAAIALQGILAGRQFPPHPCHAEDAVMMADMLIEKLNEGKNE